MPKTRKSSGYKKRRKTTRRSLRKLRGGDLLPAEQQAIVVCDFILQGINNRIKYLTKRASPIEVFDIEFATIQNRFQIREAMEPYKLGVQYLKDHMQHKIKSKTTKKALQEIFVTEEMTPYDLTVRFLDEFDNHIFQVSFPLIQMKFTVGDLEKLKKRFEKMKQELYTGV